MPEPARAPGRTAARPSWRRIFEKNGLPFAPIRGPSSCLTTRTSTPPAAWPTSPCPTASAPARPRAPRCSRCAWTASAWACACSHTTELLAALGYDGAAIEALRAQRAVG
jgi:crotonobetainyl-CoA:carnitine CoA-transferase CaiB-like acyl-CoA transferase